MADAGIKKVTIKSADFPYIQFTKAFNPSTLRDEIDELYYGFRYRIISEDKNRTSAWAPIQKIVMPDVTTPFPYTSTSRIAISTTANGTQKVAAALWTNPLLAENPTDYEKTFNKISVFDVWVRWNNTNTEDPIAAGWSNWEFATTVSSNSFSILIPAGRQGIDVAIQIPTDEKLRDYNDNKLTMFRKTSKL